VGLPVSDRISVPGRTQEFGGITAAFAYRTGTVYGGLFNTLQLAAGSPLCRSYNPRPLTGLGWSAFARHY
jgi:hypothetical protein